MVENHLSSKKVLIMNRVLDDFHTNLMLRHFLCALYGYITWISGYKVGSERRIRQNVHMKLSWSVREVTLASKLTAFLRVHMNNFHCESKSVINAVLWMERWTEPAKKISTFIEI